VIAFEHVCFDRESAQTRSAKALRHPRWRRAAEPATWRSPSGLRRVLEDVSFEVRRGETVALVGRSGAGKSTTLKLIIRLLDPASGRIVVDGRDTREWDPIALRRRTGYVLQEVGLFPHMSVARNVGLAPALAGWPIDRCEARVRELLALVGLEPGEFGGRRPDELSGGQRQRIGVARALAADPAVLLMDEPFGALDPITRLELQREFRRIRSAVRTTVLLVTHDMREAFALADRIGVMERGRLLVLDAPEALRASGDPTVRLLLDSMIGV
jgi:osmoprotectant transport system ATP-binding protein